MTRRRGTWTKPLIALLVPIKSMTPDPRNARTHDDRNARSIRASLERFGQQKPIVVDASRTVVAGNATLAAAIDLGWTHLAAVRTDLSDAERTAYAIADNRTAELADWSGEVLAELMDTLDDDLRDLLEFTGEEIDEILKSTLGQGPPEGEAFARLPEGDGSGFRQMTFTLSDDQAETVFAAVKAAKAAGAFIDTGNENSNGNALSRIAEAYRG